MNMLLNGILKLKIWRDTAGQDLTEYALVGAFVATAGAAVFPEIGSSITSVFGRIVAVLANSGGDSVSGSN